MIYYEVFGEGEPLIVLHSGGMSHEEWLPQIKAWEKRFKVIAIDQPGHGCSALKGEKLSISECGHAVLEVMEKEGVTSAHFCGSSMGGATALWVTMNRPERVKKLVLYRCNYRKNMATFRSTTSMSDPDYWISLGVDRYLSRLHRGQGGDEAWKTVITRVSDALNPDTTDHDYRLSALETIECPVMIVSGDRDPLVPMEDIIAMYQAIPTSSLWVLPHASHVTATNTWRATIFAEEVERFLTRKRELTI